MNPNPRETYRTGFIAFDTALDLVRCLRVAVEQIAQHDRSLADQIRRATSSISLNIAEGRRRNGKDRLHLWRVAAGSADETRAALLVADGWGYLAAEHVATALDLLDQLLAMLWRMTH